MARKRKKGIGMLLLGDIGVFIVSLWLTLALRNLNVPAASIFVEHLAPFSLLFVVWILIFFIAGLYERRILLIKSKLPSRLFSAHAFNLAIATLFFYVIPYFGISPKITLFLYLLVSTAVLAIWRLVVYGGLVNTTSESVLLLASGNDIDYLCEKLKTGNSSVVIASHLKPEDLNPNDQTTVENFIKTELEEHDTSILAVDLINPNTQRILPALYSLLFKGVQFINVHDLYEETTDKVPLGLINESWFLEYASIQPNFVYTAIKRLMDIALAFPLFIISLFFYPFVWLAIKLEDQGPVFIFQQRVGVGDGLVNIPKFRSMTVSDDGAWVTKNDQRITKVGAFLRKSRIDELPQLWNILKGEISLIGPRPELPKLVELYKKEIPHYNVRHLIKPGLSGWAQIHHEKPPHSIEETVEKLAYDLYYIKHRSLWLDLKIALQTIKTLLSRVGV